MFKSQLDKKNGSFNLNERYKISKDSAKKRRGPSILRKILTF
jgi:hypothetical protein